jgi:hypothetical protein
VGTPSTRSFAQGTLAVALQWEMGAEAEPAVVPADIRTEAKSILLAIAANWAWVTPGPDVNTRLPLDDRLMASTEMPRVSGREASALLRAETAAAGCRRGSHAGVGVGRETRSSGWALDFGGVY